MDEAQELKNEKGKISRRVRIIRAKSRIAMTGSPINNSEAEVATLVRVLQGPHDPFT